MKHNFHMYQKPLISVLSDQTINKIAAGEVIENPASVVKELVENSLDAGATEITVEIKSGGRELIRVTDNGSGMSSEDALLCLQRHATSKIREVEDIQILTTMGFRGEALPSIASISKLTLLTCPQGRPINDATFLMVEAGEILSHASAARSSGTTIEVKSLFFNVPVRRQFQKSPNFDTQEILKRLTLLSLGYPQIQFSLISDGKSLLNTPISSLEDPLGGRIQTVLGKDFFVACKRVSFHCDSFTLEGFIGDPSFTRHQKTGQYLFINRRAVQSTFISYCVREGYGTLIPVQRYPVFVLHLNLNGSLVDVNVHPQKKEVRLRQESQLRGQIIEAIQNAIRANHFDPITLPSSSISLPSCAPFEKIVTPELDEEPPLFNAPTSTIFEQRARRETPQATLFDAIIPENYSSPKKLIPRIYIMLPGYIVVDPQFFGKPEGLCLVDQQPDSSRVHYERMLKNKPGQADIQLLLAPLMLDFSTLESASIRAVLPLLLQIGFHIQEFGPHTFSVESIPASLSQEEVKDKLLEIVHDLESFQDHRHLERAQEKQLARTATRLALSSQRRLSFEEAQKLVISLGECESPFHCPLGRDTLIFIKLEDISKLKT